MTRYLQHICNSAVTIISFGLVITSSVVCLSWSEALDSYVLAIQYFDPCHEKGLKFWGREHKFINSALRAVKASLPDITKYHMDLGYVWVERKKVDVLSVLRLSPTFKSKKHDRIQGATVIAIAEKIGRGCRTTKTTSESVAVNGDIHRYTYTTWQLYDHCDERLRNCDNTKVVDWLCSRGIRQIFVKTRRFGGPTEATLYLLHDGPFDMKFLADQLNSDSMFDEVFGDSSVEEVLPENVGVGPWPYITVNNQNKMPDYKEPVRFFFSMGTRKCNAECVRHRHWLVEAIPTGTMVHDDWVFDTKILAREGDPIPGHLK